MKRILPLLFLMVISLNAQNAYQLEGLVFDGSGTLVSVGDVLLLKKENKELLQYTSLVEGRFIFQDIPEGLYFLQFSALGYRAHQQEVHLSQNLTLTINLKEETTILSEVEVVAAKNPISYKAGTISVDVQNPYFASIPDPVELLSRLPKVQVAADRESITILGKGNPLLYLGNQRISMGEFAALAIDAIGKVEIIANPSAKYEAEGRAVIRVTLKKETAGGLQGSLQETVSQKRNFNNYLAFNSSFAAKNLTIRANLGYNQLLQWESNSFLFGIPEREVLVDYLVLIPKNVRRQLNPGFGVYYQWNETDYVSVNASARLQTDDASFFTNTQIVDRGVEELVYTSTNNDNGKNYYSTSFNLNKKLTDSWNLFSGVQFSGFQQNLDTEISNSPDQNNFALEQQRAQEYQINSLAFRLDAEKELSKGLKWESGINLGRAKTDAFTKIQEFPAGNETQINFAYDESLYAAYSSVSGKLTKKIDFELGLRTEYNRAEGTVTAKSAPVLSRENTSLFPKVNLSIPVDSTKTLTLNYARSIERPDFSRASTITVFINPFLEGAGNVGLRPTLTDEWSINFQKGNTSFFANFHQSSNPTNFTISYDVEADNAILSLVNLERESGFNAGVSFPWTKGIWTSNNSISLYYHRLQDGGAAFSSTKPYVYAYTNHQLKIAKDTTLVLGAWAMGKRQEGIFKRNGLAVLEASISKTFYKNWDCTLRFNDITRSMNFEEAYSLDGVMADGTYFGDMRELALSLKYRFGSKDKAKFKNKDVDANLDRIN